MNNFNNQLNETLPKSIDKLRYSFIGTGKRVFRNSYRLFNIRFILPKSLNEYSITIALWFKMKFKFYKEYDEFRLFLGFLELHYKKSLAAQSTIRGY